MDFKNTVKKIGDFLKTNDIGLILVSALIGFFLWALLSNGQDPITTRTIDVPVTFLNEDMLLEKESRVLLSDRGEVQLIVSVRKSKASEINASMFSCTADVMTHSGADLSAQLVHVSVEQIDNSGNIIDWEYQKGDPFISVAFDEYITKTFAIQLKETGKLPAGLTRAGEISFEPASVILSGPSTAFGNINSVVAEVNLAALRSGEIATEIALKLYDNNDKPIPGDIAVSMDTKTAMMRARIEKGQSVLISCDGTVGNPAEGTRFKSLTIEPYEVVVQGLEESISTFTDILLPALNISGLSKTTDFKVDISSRLPEDAKIVSDGNIVTGEYFVTVRVEIEAQTEKTVSVPVEAIEITESKESLSYIVAHSVSVRVRGFLEDIESITAADLGPYINVSGLETGKNQKVLLHFNLPDNVTVLNPESIFAEVNIYDNPDYSETESESETETPSESETEHESESESEVEPGA